MQTSRGRKNKTFLIFFFLRWTKKKMVVADSPGASLGSGLTRLGVVDFSAMFDVSKRKRVEISRSGRERSS